MITVAIFSDKPRRCLIELSSIDMGQKRDVLIDATDDKVVASCTQTQFPENAPSQVTEQCIGIDDSAGTYKGYQQQKMQYTDD